MKKLTSQLLFWLFLFSGSALGAAEFPLKATCKIDLVWATTFQATITLENNTTTPTSSWITTFSLPQGYSMNPNFSNGPGIMSVNGQNVTFKNPTNGGVIGAGGSTKIVVMIIMPRGAATVINNLTAVANGSGTTPTPTVPSAPVLNPIQLDVNKNYTVSWNSVANATSYLLQQSTTSNFSNAQSVAQGNILSKSFSNQPNGTYYYRVLASNSAGSSAFSNVQSVTLSQTPIPIPVGIEHSEWYIDWTTWLTEPPFVLPKNTNMINIFVGTLAYGDDGKPTLEGFGTFTSSSLTAFTAYCAAQQPPIPVKVSIGGAGGMYDRCWDLLTAANLDAFAQGMVDFCHNHGLVGVDFDYEHYTSIEQQSLVGTLIKKFKLLDPKMQTSLCTNAGFGPFFPWPPIIRRILDAAMITQGNCAVDRLYIMSYYDPIENEKNWINGWANMVITDYGFTKARVSVGIDDFDFHAYDPVEFAAWAASMGYSTAHWAFDPAQHK